LIGALLLLCVPSSNSPILKAIALNSSCTAYIMSLFL